ncbi:MAG: hypothetical protein DRJ38_04885 [Thermoprotei archaeon]|nr:MAG: hypothetical protein DRJ38_04885 [Thermoprotei archaeon]
MPFLLLMSFILAFYVAWSVGANDETMAVLAGSGFTSILVACLIGAFMDFLGAVLLGYKVEETMGEKLLTYKIDLMDTLVIVAAVATWLVVASYRGWPVSTTHSAVGAAIGLGMYKWGISGVRWESLLNVVAGWVISPIMGFIGAYLTCKLFDLFLAKSINGFDKSLKIAKLSSLTLLAWASYTSFFRGANDIANATAFLSAVYENPFMVRLISGLGMALGLVMLGRRVVKSVGVELVELTPVMGLAIQISVALTVSIGTLLGLPLSGTHILVMAVAGIGVAKKIWINVKGLKEILATWIITFPGAAVLAVLFAILV